jgi:hypothetical protein
MIKSSFKSVMKNHPILLIIILFFAFTGVLVGELYLNKPQFDKYEKIVYNKFGYTNKIFVNWAIGIYRGTSPYSFVPDENTVNPILSAKDVHDVPAVFVADPFMVKEGGCWYLFFEVLKAKDLKGVIGYATSKDGRHWKYESIVLSEPFHMSYPYVFNWQNAYYMIPETYIANSIRLYKALDFPTKWLFIKSLVVGKYSDSSIVNFNNKWWLFTNKFSNNDTLCLFYADDLLGPWIEHPKSPIVKGDGHIARPGGRVIIFNNKLIRYAQDDRPQYGLKVRAFLITEITTTSYKEQELTEGAVLNPAGKGWNARGMHNIDPHQVSDNSWIACVDGWSDIVKVRKKLEVPKP